MIAVFNILFLSLSSFVRFFLLFSFFSSLLVIVAVALTLISLRYFPSLFFSRDLSLLLNSLG